jgi:hypothetical protein
MVKAGSFSHRANRGNEPGEAVSFKYSMLNAQCSMLKGKNPVCNNDRGRMKELWSMDEETMEGGRTEVRRSQR